MQRLRLVLLAGLGLTMSCVGPSTDEPAAPSSGDAPIAAPSGNPTDEVTSGDEPGGTASSDESEPPPTSTSESSMALPLAGSADDEPDVGAGGPEDGSQSPGAAETGDDDDEPSEPTRVDEAMADPVAAPDGDDDEPASDEATPDSDPAPTDPAPTDPAPTDPAPADTASRTCNLPGNASATTPTIWVIGDSTASEYASDRFPRTGWAQPLQEYFAPACAAVRDRAISGRSSKSFFDEGAWTPVRDGLRAGDYVLIQFGHNDEKSDDPLRFTEPFGTFQRYLSIYVDESRDRGATPILLTPIHRNAWTGTAVRDTHGDYPVGMRQLATARGVDLVDATQLTEAYFERIGQAATTELFMNLAAGQSPNYPDGNADNTHLRVEGAHAIAELILADLARQDLPIGRLVKTLPTPP